MACLLKSRVFPEGQSPARGTNLIFVLELDAVASALWSLRGTLPGASAVAFIDNDSAAQVLAKGGPNHSSTNYLVIAYWFLAAREPLGIWLRREASRATRQMLRTGADLASLLNLDRLVRQKR